MSEKILRGNEPLPSLVNHFAGHRGRILSVKFHPNLSNIFTGGSDGFIMKWDILTPSTSSTRTLRFGGDSGPIHDLDLSKTGELMASASEDSTMRVWVPSTTGDCMFFKGHNAPVRSVCFNPINDSVIASASEDKTVKIWSIVTKKAKGKETHLKSYDSESSFTGHTNCVRSVRYSSDGNLLCTSSDDNTIRLFDTRHSKAVGTLTSPAGTPTHADFNPSTPVYIGASVTENGFLMFDIRALKVVQLYERLTGNQASNNNTFCFHPSGDFAVCGFEDATIKILDLVAGRPIFTLYGARKALMAVDFNKTGTLFATGGDDKQLLVWEPTLLPYEIGQENCASSKEPSASIATYPPLPLAPTVDSNPSSPNGNQ